MRLLAIFVSKFSINGASKKYPLSVSSSDSEIIRRITKKMFPNLLKECVREFSKARRTPDSSTCHSLGSYFAVQEDMPFRNSKLKVNGCKNLYLL